MKISVERSLLADISETLTMYGIPYPALNNLLKDNPDPPPPCAIKPLMETLDETMRRLEEAALNWKPKDNPRWNTAPTHTTVSRQDLQQIDDMLTEYYNKSLEDKNVTIFNVRDMIHKMLDTGFTDEDRAWADEAIEKHEANRIVSQSLRSTEHPEP
jgi:hypothetical protein